MKYIYDFAQLPRQPDLLAQINNAAARLALKLAELNAKELGLSELHERVLQEKQARLTIELQAFCFVAAWAMKSVVGKPLSQTAFLECGGGIGMLSLLARELGVGTVVYNDIYDVACKDAETIACAAGLAADHYVEGDIDAVQAFADQQGVTFNAIGSFDVIEHVYDIEQYLKKFRYFKGKPKTLAMASYANMYNRRYVREIMPFQRHCELQGREKRFGHYTRDTMKPYFEIRREMITRYADGRLNEGDINTLAELTRGMRRDDIESAVQVYIDRKQLPAPLAHPTNTCDPYTGNWQEHLMDPNDLVVALAHADYQADWLSGYFSCRSNSAIKRSVGKCLNLTIRLFNKRAIPIAPFYMLIGCCE